MEHRTKRYRFITVVATLSLLLAAGCTGQPSTGGPDAGATDPDANLGGTVPPPLGGEVYAVVSGGEFFATPPPSCDGPFIDHDCDAFIPLTCGPDEHIDYDDGVICPVCTADSGQDPTSCAGWRQRHGEFLRHLVSESCANWCETDNDCFAWEINNACGTHALSLTGAIDEEPLYFAGAFAEESCGECGAVPQTVFMRRAGSDVIEGDGQHSGLLLRFRPVCYSGQCALTTRD